MLRRIRPGLVRELWARELPRPVDVVNLITPADFERYRWYGLLVLPALKAAGGRVLWMSRHERALSGEIQAEKLLIVRYPSHRRFLAMTLNPYYFAINLLREAGVCRFEASFTHSSHADPELFRRHALVGVHFRSAPGAEALDSICDVFGKEGYELAYATRAVAALGVLDPPRDTDPAPLSFGELGLFAPKAEDSRLDTDLVAAKLARLTDAFSLQSYRREPRSTYRPSLLGAPQAASR